MGTQVTTYTNAEALTGGNSGYNDGPPWNPYHIINSTPNTTPVGTGTPDTWLASGYVRGKSASTTSHPTSVAFFNFLMPRCYTPGTSVSVTFSGMDVQTDPGFPGNLALLLQNVAGAWTTDYGDSSWSATAGVHYKQSTSSVVQVLTGTDAQYTLTLSGNVTAHVVGGGTSGTTFAAGEPVTLIFNFSSGRVDSPTFTEAWVQLRDVSVSVNGTCAGFSQGHIF